MYAGYCVARIDPGGERAGVSERTREETSPLRLLAVVFHVPARARAARSQVLTLAAHLAGALLPDGNPTLLGQVPGDAAAVLGAAQGAPLPWQDSHPRSATCCSARWQAEGRSDE